MSGAEAPAGRSGRKGRGENPLWSLLELAVLWTFAVAQPLFDLLKDNPEFFAARGSTGLDVISFAVLLVVVPPLLLLGVELLIGLAGDAARRGVHLVFIAGLVALIAAQALKKAFDASDLLLILLSIAIGGGVAGLYAGAEPVRTFLRVLSPAPLVFLVLFLFTNPISKLAFPDEAQARTIGGIARAPIVVVLLDELPSNTLVDDRGRIDAERYPGFGELARNATWFKNAYTVYDSTERAQPAIMDGNLPQQHLLSVWQDPPHERLRGGDVRLLARHLRRGARRGGLRGPAELDRRGPRTRVAARGLAARHGGRPAQRVGELGQLRGRSGRRPR